MINLKDIPEGERVFCDGCYLIKKADGVFSFDGYEGTLYYNGQEVDESNQTEE